MDPDSYARNKILLGLNFYGFDYTADGGAHVTGKGLVDMLTEATEAKFSWDGRTEESFCEFRYSYESIDGS